MKIDELIEELEAVKQEHGNLEVFLSASERGMSKFLQLNLQQCDNNLNRAVISWKH